MTQHRTKLTPGQWGEIQTAYASGIGLREIARAMQIPAGTVLARAKREGWTRQIEQARAIAPVTHQAPAISAPEAAAGIMASLSEKSRLAAARATANALEHASSLPGNEALAASRNVKDSISAAATVHGWDGKETAVSVSILTQNFERIEAIEIEPN